MQSADSAPLGLQFLLTAAEELVAPREDLSSGRRAELRQLLLREVPATLAVLTGERRWWESVRDGGESERDGGESVREMAVRE